MNKGRTKEEKNKSIQAFDANLTITYALLECCSCKEMYFVHTDGIGSIFIPDFIVDMEVFPADCPICDSGDFARLMNYIPYEVKEKKTC